MQIGKKNLFPHSLQFFFKGLIISTGPSGSYILYRSWDFNVMCENVFEFDGGLTCTCQEFDLGCGVSMPLIVWSEMKHTDTHGWWVGVLRFKPNWIKFKKPSGNRVSLTIFVQF